jgi:hypothetical protein
MQSCGYEGSHSEPEEEEEDEGEEEELIMVVVRPLGSPGCPAEPPSGSTGRAVVVVVVVTAKVGGVIDISTKSTNSSITLIIGSEKHEYYLKELMQSPSMAKHIKAKQSGLCRGRDTNEH